VVILQQPTEGISFESEGSPWDEVGFGPANENVLHIQLHALS